jgi:hypothetical protein
MVWEKYKGEPLITGDLLFFESGEMGACYGVDHLNAEGIVGYPNADWSFEFFDDNLINGSLINVDEDVVDTITHIMKVRHP